MYRGVGVVVRGHGEDGATERDPVTATSYAAPISSCSYSAPNSRFRDDYGGHGDYGEWRCQGGTVSGDGDGDWVPVDGDGGSCGLWDGRGKHPAGQLSFLICC